MIMGNFNDVTRASEKLGGNPIDRFYIRKFNEMINNYNLINLGLKGNTYTWMNLLHSGGIIQ